MKIAVIHGQSHQGSTCHIARMLADKIGGEVTEFFLPRDFGGFCVGCTGCITRSEQCCPHYEQLKPITDAMDKADVIILASPVYVYHATGAMKAFLDHYGYRWMIHRPEARMFFKQGVCISTAAGGGTKSANRDMADSLFFWGVPRIYQIGWNVRAMSWDQVTEKRREKIDRTLTRLADQIRSRAGRVKPGIKTRLYFEVMRRLQTDGWNPADTAYWKEQGWDGRARPWKNPPTE